MIENSHQRYEGLDSLRGLAALSVLFHHFMIIFPFFESNTFHDDSWLNLLKYSPLHIFWFGYEAVVLFFVLSGVVLSLSFYSKQSTNVVPFLIKRFFRIFIPSYVATATALLLYLLISPQPIPTLSNWFNAIWIHPITFGSILNHLLLIKYFGYGQFVPVLWTLVMEVRISLIFPFLMKLMNFVDWKLSVLMGLLASLAYYGVDHLSGSSMLSIPLDYFSTLTFLNMFVIGALLAKYKSRLAEWTTSLSFTKKIALLTMSIALYSSRYWLFFEEGVYNSHSIWSDVAITIGIAVLISLVLAGEGARFLKKRPLLLLGKISFSLYLYHAVVLLAMTHLLHARLPMSLVLILAGIVAFAVALASYNYIELPAIYWGKRIAKNVSVT